MNKSIYTTALEYGHTRIFEGVNYNEVKNHIEREHKNKFDYHSERAFFDWFTESFNSTKFSRNNSSMIHFVHTVMISEHLKKGDPTTDAIKNANELRTEYKFYITGESDRKYLEYIELQESRKNARQAFVLSILAILISTLGVLFSPLIEHFYLSIIKPYLEF